MTGAQLIALARQRTGLTIPDDARTYVDLADHAGLGTPHRMVAWTDPDGTPRSVVLSE